MAENDESIIRRFQENLEPIRKVAGWTSQELAEEIGVTRQTISNLESGRTTMTKTQYLALRTVLNFKILQNQNQSLAKIVKSLVDDVELPDGYETTLATYDKDIKDRKIGAVTGLSVMTAAAAGSVGAIGILAGLTALWKK